MQWNTGFTKNLTPLQTPNPAQWSVWDGVNQLIPTTAGGTAFNFVSGSYVVGPPSAHPPLIQFVNTDDDFKDIDGFQVPDYAIVPTPL